MANSPTRREATHDRILEVASRDIRRSGCAGVGVADVMKQAGLTHGGFYAHFESRDALLAEAIERAGRDSASTLTRSIEARRAQGVSAFRALVERYLSDAHLSQPELGCVVASLASEMPRQSPAVYAAAAARVRGLVALVQASLPADSARALTLSQATVVASTLVGALQLARALGPNPHGKAVLAATRDALLAQYGA